MIQLSEQFVPLMLNAEKVGKPQAKQFGVTGYPTILFVDGAQKVQWKIVGYLPPDQFATQMKLALGLNSEFPRLKRRLAKRPGDLNAIAKIIPYYGGTGQTSQLDPLLASAFTSSKPHDPALMETIANEAGDAYQSANQDHRAVRMFLMAVNPSFPKRTAYARISLAYCEFSLKQPKAAIPYLQALLAMGPAADQYRATANQLLAYAQKAP